MRVTSVLRKLLGLCASVVICGFELVEAEGERAKLVVRLRRKSRTKGRCGRCGVVAPWFDNGGGDADLAPCRRGLCHERARLGCAPGELSRTRADGDRGRLGSTRQLVLAGLRGPRRLRRHLLEQAGRGAALRHQLAGGEQRLCPGSHRGARPGRPALGLVAIAIDEVKYKKGQRYYRRVRPHDRQGDLGRQGTHERHRQFVLRCAR